MMLSGSSRAPALARLTISRRLARSAVSTSRRLHSHQKCSFATPNRPTQSHHRWLSTTTTSTSTTTTDAAPVRDFFLDNLGKIFLSIIGVIIASLIRSHFGTKNLTAIRDELEETAALDPKEIDDLRMANRELSPDLFRLILQELNGNSNSSGSGQRRMTYEEFVQQVRTILMREKGETCTIGLGYLLDRVVIAALQQQQTTTNNTQEESLTTTSTDDSSMQDLTMPLPFWMTVLSLALHGPVPDRIRVLYEVLQSMPPQEEDATNSMSMMTMNDDDHNDNNSPTTPVTLDKVVTMVGYLQDTCQLVPDKQVVPIVEDKYPVQQHRRGTPRELVAWEAAADAAAKDDVLDIDAFADVLRSKSVCAWGECYFKKKYVP
ncbi:IQ calmodulin-binding motif [Seminavis robusta]|uniref:IQ calmodulin-binding motif n=1 Tax=Seminavis robusta TaxID=568900 RepID=A0A9N8H9H5_9STRA|nr:IQ calmodulin-binding motif [Seminavis robusta]|eukprot:Sro118_g057560.1 IQ calmodulin-binding motif (377) ;mRNA; r:2314-3444